MTPPPAAWLDTFRQLLHHYLPPFENTPMVNVGGLAAVAAGLVLVFRGAKLERSIVSFFGLLLGACLGWQIALWLDTPGPLSAAVGGVVLTIVAYRTYKVWLAGGSVIVLFLLAMTYQLGLGIGEWKLPANGAGDGTSHRATVTLPTAEQMQANLYPKGVEQLRKIKEQVLAQLRNLRLVGWLVPLLAAIVGAILAYWALRVFVVVWLGLVGAIMAVLGGSAFLCAHWPEVRAGLINEPRGPAAVVLGLWLAGLILQAKEARFPSKKPAEEAAKQPAKA
jgi:hypothetical protein